MESRWRRNVANQLPPGLLVVDGGIIEGFVTLAAKILDGDWADYWALNTPQAAGTCLLGIAADMQTGVNLFQNVDKPVAGNFPYGFHVHPDNMAGYDA